MIKVENTGYSANKYHALSRVQKQNNISSNPSFEGRVPNVQIPSTALKDAIEYILPKSARILKTLGSSGGEIQNIIINAIGTGLVAPIFIKYNFLSDADEDTRTYSAWRQPVSAVLAIVTQAGLTAPFYKIFDNWSNNGKFGEELNKTLFQDEYWLRKNIKAENPHMPKEQIEKLVKKSKEEQRISLINSLENRSTVFYSDYNGSKFKISDSAYRSLLNETIDNLSKSDSELLANIRKTIKKRTERSKYYRSHNEEASNILNEFQVKIKNAKNLKEIDKFISEKISGLKSNKDSAEMITILDEVRKRAKVVSGASGAISFSDIQTALNEKVTKMQEHVKKYKNIKTDKEVEDIVKSIVSEEENALNAALDFYKSLKSKINEKSNIAELKKAISDKAKQLKIEGSALNKDFVNEVANQLVDRTNKHMKWYKQFVGVFVSLSILPVTCTLLNWIYPRFMDIFFPKLSSKKHNNESAKLAAKAPKVMNSGQIPADIIKSSQTVQKKAEVA